MRASESGIDDKVLFEELFKYFHHLQDRRWQYFLVLLIADGLLLRAWKDIKTVSGTLSQILFCAGVILVFVVSLRLLSRTRLRIHELGYEINQIAQRKLVALGKPGIISWNGLGVWIYLAVVGLASPWFVELWDVQCLVACVAMAAFLATLIFGVKIRNPPHRRLGSIDHGDRFSP